MSFLSPEALAFAAAVPVVILFYLLKRKRVVKLVSSTLLWQKFLAETQASKPFQRLRHNWLLVLQILLLALVVGALMRPFVAGPGRAGRLRVVILDASASMQATDVKPSRFAQARDEALRWVSSLAGSDQVVLLLAGAVTEVKQSATSDKTALRRALEACAPTDSPTRLTEALKLAETLIKNQSEPEIHLFSDGAAPNLEEFEHKNLPLLYHRVGTGRDNLGIVSLDARANPDDPAQRAVFVAVGNFAAQARQTDVELRFDDQVIETRPVSLPPTNTVPLVFLAPQSRDGVFTVRLTARDDLAADNQASLVSLLPKPVRVLLVAPEKRFLEKALRTLPRVQVTVVPELTDPAESFDVVALDGVLPAVWPRPNVLAAHVIPTNWFARWDVVSSPLIVDWKNTHSLLRFVSFDNVRVAEAFRVKCPDWGVSLVDSPETPLLIAGQREGQRIVWIGFDLMQSTWPLRLSFPIFIANAVEWLNPASARAAELMVRAGEPFRHGLAQPVAEARLTEPDGRTRPILLERNAREILVGDTGRQGVYRLQAGTNEVTFCVNLMDSVESQIAPREELPFGKYARVASTTLPRANLELWRWVAGAGLLLLLFEWWFYHKRTV